MKVKADKRNITFKSRLKKKLAEEDRSREEIIGIAFTITEHKLKEKVIEDFPPDNWEKAYNEMYKQVVTEMVPFYTELIRKIGLPKGCVELEKEKLDK